MHSRRDREIVRRMFKCPSWTTILAAEAILVCASSAWASEFAATTAGAAPVEVGDTTDALNIALLESTGAVIGKVWIDNNNIFDLGNPDENKALYRFANRTHVTTRPAVIHQQLLFSPGDKISVQALEESERLIRSNRYIHAASVRPVKLDDGVVDIEVTTSDVWTLMPKIALSRSGGTNNTALGVKETNLLGTGIELELAFKSDVDRDSSSIKFVDRHLGNSWYSLAAYIAENSDGRAHHLQLEKPFYSLDSRSSVGVSTLSNDRVESFYDRGERLSEYRHQEKRANTFFGWSKGLHESYTRRYMVGLALEQHDFSPYSDSNFASGPVPADRKFFYPYIGFELLEDNFEKASNHDQIGRVEDRFLGTRLSANLGFATTAAGSDRDALLLDTSFQKGFGSSERHSLLLAAGLNARVEDTGVENLLLDTSARYFKRQSEKRLLYIALNASYGQSLDLDQHLQIGGDSGLRGYPLRYQGGDKRALLTVEQRYFTDWYPWRLFKVGGALFFDIGRVWGDSPVQGTNAELLRDVGFGLRIGNDRSGFGRMIHIDVAMPLDGDSQIDDVQFLVSTKKSF
jgi:Omp85 superfamily domain